MILGMDAIMSLGGVKVGNDVQCGTGEPCLLGAGVVESGSLLELSASDFVTKFDGESGWLNRSGVKERR